MKKFGESSLSSALWCPGIAIHNIPLNVCHHHDWKQQLGKLTLLWRNLTILIVFGKFKIPEEVYFKTYDFDLYSKFEETSS